MCAACGLYYLAELVEEYTSTMRRIMYVSCFAVLAAHVLFIFEGLPLSALGVGLATHACYLWLLQSFPFIKFNSPQFLTSLGMCVLSHYFWMSHFMVHFHAMTHVRAELALARARARARATADHRHARSRLARSAGAELPALQRVAPALWLLHLPLRQRVDAAGPALVARRLDRLPLLWRPRRRRKTSVSTRRALGRIARTV